MAEPMDPELKRALTIGGAAIAGVLVLVGIAFAVSSGDSGDDTTSVRVPDRTSTSSSSTSSTSSTSTSTTTTLPPVTTPPTAPPTSPPTIIVIPPTEPPTSSSSSTTSSTLPGGSTTTSTTRPPGEQELNDSLELALNGGVPPAPGTPPRVHVKFVTDDNDLGDFVRVTWALDPTLTTNEEALAELRQEAFALLQAVQVANLPGNDPIVLRATLPDADGVEQRVARLVYERDTLDAIDFATLDPRDLFALADDIEITDPLPVPIPTTSTTSTT